MNPNDEYLLLSANELADVDDPHGYLNSMLNQDTLAYYDKPGVPEHQLKLRVGDICFLLRTISKKNHLSRNTRVRIRRISRFKLQVDHISRIRFKITHHSGFALIRTQISVGLVYAMTKNKA